MKVVLRTNFGVCDAIKIKCRKAHRNFAEGKASFGKAKHHSARCIIPQGASHKLRSIL